nr:hypothetical protein [uncultured Undibacterium sp.]
MQNMTIGWPNRIYEATLSGGSYASTLPLSNLKSRETSKVARTASISTTHTTFDIDLGVARNIGVLALLFHNLSATAKVQWLGNASSTFTSPTYDSGLNSVYPTGALPFGSLEWGDSNFWLGTVSLQAVAGYKAPYIVGIPSRPSLRYWRLKIEDTGNSDGNVFFRAFIGDAWTVKYNMSYGASLGHTDLTEVKTSLGGQDYFKKRPRYRTHRFSLNHLTNTEFQRVLDMERDAGISDELLIMPDLDDADGGFRRNCLCRLVQLPAIRDDDFEKKSAEFEIKELL